MGIHTGMRGKDLQKFLMVARDMNVTILVRHTNDDSLKYVQVTGYYPKPAVVKAKTADMDPPAVVQLIDGKKTVKRYDIAGLVVHPGFQPNCYRGAKIEKAVDCWKHTMEVLAPSLVNTKVDPDKPDTWSIWGVDRKGAEGSRWSWRVDINPASKHFGALQLKNESIDWSYVHGDYDLKDVIVRGKETENTRTQSRRPRENGYRLPEGSFADVALRPDRHFCSGGDSVWLVGMSSPDFIRHMIGFTQLCPSLRWHLCSFCTVYPTNPH